MTAHAAAGTLRRVKLATIAIALCATAIAAAPASADSIVYAKQGNLYLSSADGSKGYQLTFDGGYSSPSQAEDGTIGALHYKQLVRMNRSGQLLNAPIEAMGSDGTHGIGGLRAADLAGWQALRVLLLRPDLDRRPRALHPLAQHRLLRHVDVGRPLHEPGHGERVQPHVRPARVGDERPAARHA
jgi:hypothetical protein